MEGRLGRKRRGFFKLVCKGFETSVAQVTCCAVVCFENYLFVFMKNILF